MAKVKEILAELNKLASVERKMDFDNVGLLVGWPDREVDRILISLDITEEVADEADALGAQLIVSHHPVFFKLDSLCSDQAPGSTALKLAEYGISAICMHTNLDVSGGGVNDVLAEKLGLMGTECMIEYGVDDKGETYGLGRVGTLNEPTSLCDYLAFVKETLGAGGLRYTDAGKPVYRIAVCGGSGGSELSSAAEKGCDTYVTADVKYNTFIDAIHYGINIIDAGHFPTENVVVGKLYGFLSSAFPEMYIKISAVNRQPEMFF